MNTIPPQNKPRTFQPCTVPADPDDFVGWLLSITYTTAVMGEAKPGVNIEDLQAEVDRRIHEHRSKI